jgi:ferredoxin
MPAPALARRDSPNKGSRKEAVKDKHSARPPPTLLQALLDRGGGAFHGAAVTTLQPPRAQSTEAFMAKAGPELAGLCTACGACFEACPMVDRIGLSGADAKSATEGLRRLAAGEPAPADTIAWVSACTKSGLCVAACPERDAGLDAMLLVRLAKQRAINETRQVPAKQDPTLFPRVKVFARLQLTDEELAKWL